MHYIHVTLISSCALRLIKILSYLLVVVACCALYCPLLAIYSAVVGPPSMSCEIRYPYTPWSATDLTRSAIAIDQHPSRCSKKSAKGSLIKERRMENHTSKKKRVGYSLAEFCAVFGSLPGIKRLMNQCPVGSASGARSRHNKNKKW